MSESEFHDLDPADRPDEIETLCINCHENGVTRMLVTKIPHFREIIIMAFECPHCNWRNNEVQFGGAYQMQGCTQTLKVTTKEDLNRQIVKSDSCSFKVVELDFEIPPTGKKGTLNTIEGLLVNAVDGLQGNLPLYRAADETKAAQVEAFLNTLAPYSRGEVLPFTVVLDDPAGNSFIENPFAPKPDPEMKLVKYTRNAEQDELLGLRADDDDSSSTSSAASSVPKAPAEGMTDEQARQKFEKAAEEQEVMKFPASCPNCEFAGEVRMVMCDIPHFKEIVLMAFNCEQCGFKSNEVKPGGAVSEKGQRYILRLRNFPLDLNRDILKSHTASFGIPELMLELTPGTLGGRFTTIEGLLLQIAEELKQNQFVYGDSGEDEQRNRMYEFFTRLAAYTEGRAEFTVILDDPLANSYIQNVFAPDEDPAMIVEEYERSQEQNEELGIADMKTEDYGEKE